MRKLSKKAMIMLGLAFSLSSVAISQGIFCMTASSVESHHNPCANGRLKILDPYVDVNGHLGYQAECLCNAGYTGLFCETIKEE